MYNLFLDDERHPISCRDYPGDESIYDTEKFIEANNFDEFVKIIKEYGIPKFISFDYKLGQEKTGLDCAEFLKFECECIGSSIPEYRVHSSWPGIYGEFHKILG